MFHEWACLFIILSVFVVLLSPFAKMGRWNPFIGIAVLVPLYVCFFQFYKQFTIYHSIHAIDEMQMAFSYPIIP